MGGPSRVPDGTDSRRPGTGAMKFQEVIVRAMGDEWEADVVAGRRDPRCDGAHDLEGLIEGGYEQGEQFGINPAALVSDDHSACENFSDRQRARGVRGLIVPSAALPGTRNV